MGKYEVTLELDATIQRQYCVEADNEKEALRRAIEQVDNPDHEHLEAVHTDSPLVIDVMEAE